MKNLLLGIVLLFVIYASCIFFKCSGDVSIIYPFLAIFPCAIGGGLVWAIVAALLPSFGKSNADLKEAAKALIEKVK